MTESKTLNELFERYEKKLKQTNPANAMLEACDELIQEMDHPPKPSWCNVCGGKSFTPRMDPDGWMCESCLTGHYPNERVCGERVTKSGEIPHSPKELSQREMLNAVARVALESEPKLELTTVVVEDEYQEDGKEILKISGVPQKGDDPKG